MGTIMTHGQGFVFAGYSSQFFNMYVNTQEICVKAEQRVEQVEVPGRDGTVDFADGYRNGQIVFNVVLKDADINNKEMYRWLNKSEDILIIDSNEEVFYKGYFVGGLQKVKDGILNSFTLTFSCKPFKYKVADVQLPLGWPVKLGADVKLGNNHTWQGSGVYELPIDSTIDVRDLVYQVDGTGSITINSFTINNCKKGQKVIVDCFNKICYYKDNGNVVSKFQDFVGEFDFVDCAKDTFTIEISGDAVVSCSFTNTYI